MGTAVGMHNDAARRGLDTSLGDAAHKQFDPPIVSKKITITVK